MEPAQEPVPEQGLEQVPELYRTEAWATVKVKVPVRAPKEERAGLVMPGMMAILASRTHAHSRMCAPSAVASTSAAHVRRAEHD